MISTLIFDWGDTIMRDFPGMSGPMAFWDKVEWVPGAMEALEVLSGSYLCVIASNAGDSDTRLMRQALQRVDAEKYFTSFYTSKDLGAEKPDAEFFLRIANGIGRDAQQCVHIGNLYEKDIAGAKKAGMFTVFFNEKKILAAFPSADVVITHMNQLLHAVEKLGQC